MQVAIVVLLVIACLFLWHIAVGYPKFVASGKGEWLLVFRPNEKDHVMDCWFEPVVAYMLNKKQTTPVPAGFDKTINAVNDRSKEPWTDAYWLRDGLMFDMHGSNCGDLLETLQGWYVNFKSVNFNSGVPQQYAELVHTASRSCS
jgi:hypothetical protein